MAQKNLFKSAREKVAQAGEQLSNVAAEAKDKASQTGELLGNKASEALDKAAQAGEYLGDKAEEAKDKAVQTGEHLSDKALEAKRDYDLRRFRPIIKEQLPSAVKVMPEMIRIVDWDKRTEEDVCKDAVAFNDGSKELRFISILTKNVGLIDATFYPFAQEGIYYRDPCNTSSYINLNNYFDYLKKARVHELNQIAQDLGAIHVKISLKAERKLHSQSKSIISGAIGKSQKIESSHSSSSMQFESIEVASDKKYKGHEAHEPKLNYFRNEPDVKNIVKRRLDKNNPIYSDVETFKYINSSGIKSNDVAKIESVLKKLKISLNKSISNEVENEEKIYFEYQIEYPKE